MRAVVHTRYGGPEVLELTDVPRPDLKDDGVLVRVHHVALNALDWHGMRGEPVIARIAMGWRRPSTLIPGVDMAGVVEAVGKDVTAFRPGDEVFANKARSCAEYVAGPARLFAPKPANLTLEEAAALPAAGISALQALRDKAGIAPGQRVLINGGTGGVGTFSVQLARWLGAEVTVVTTGPDDGLLASLGAQRVIDRVTTPVAAWGDGYDVIIDNGGTPSLRSLAARLAPGGTLILVGAAPGRWAAALTRIVGARVLSRVTGKRLLGFLAHPVQADLLVLKELVEAGHVRPIIDRRYRLEEIREAMAYLETLGATGKIVLTV
ncbi:MAG: NAD(P)-dependent alcohol dehydrogenase [Chloroflexota bacterium]